MIELKNINKVYKTGKISFRALRDVSLKIAPGEFVAIMGPSGSGKSTLLHLLGFLDRPDSGSYILGGKEVSGLSDDDLAALRNRLLGFVFQQFNLLQNLNALENVMMPMIFQGKPEAERKKRAESLLASLGLQERILHKPSELSGGEQQRIAIARALANNPEIIVADEPTGNLDPYNTYEVISLLEKINSTGKTVILSTHDREVVNKLGRRVITLENGRIIRDEEKGRFII